MIIIRRRLSDMPRGLDLRRSFAFNRRPGERGNRGRIAVTISAPGPPPVDDLLTIGGDTLTVGGVDLKNG